MRHPPISVAPPVRAQLLAAARAIVEAEGPEALNLRTVARSAGVSTMAIYTLFGGKDGLMEALYVEGFTVLAEAQTVALREAGAEPGARLEALCRGHRETALAHRGHYRIMTMPAASYQPTDNGKAAARQTFETLVEAVEACPAGKRDRVRDVAYGLFALCHGMISLELLGLGTLAADPALAFEAAIRLAVATI